MYRRNRRNPTNGLGIQWCSSPTSSFGRLTIEVDRPRQQHAATSIKRWSRIWKESPLRQDQGSCRQRSKRDMSCPGRVRRAPKFLHSSRRHRNDMRRDGRSCHLLVSAELSLAQFRPSRPACRSRARGGRAPRSRALGVTRESPGRGRAPRFAAENSRYGAGNARSAAGLALVLARRVGVRSVSAGRVLGFTLSSAGKGPPRRAWLRTGQWRWPAPAIEERARRDGSCGFPRARTPPPGSWVPCPHVWPSGPFRLFAPPASILSSVTPSTASCSRKRASSTPTPELSMGLMLCSHRSIMVTGSPGRTGR